MDDASEDILLRYEVKKDELYGIIEKELRKVQESIRLVCAVPTAPSLLETTELGDELAQLQRLADAIEA
jgi:hypothetical protein